MQASDVFCKKRYRNAVQIIRKFRKFSLFYLLAYDKALKFYLFL